MKRIFSFSLIALLLAGSLGLQAKGPKKQMALQLYSIRSVFNDGNYQQKHAEVFKQLRDMGFTGVEAASYNNGKFYGVSPEQYRQDCIAAGLEPISSHATRGLNRQELDNHDFTAALQWWDQAIAAHKAAGMTYLVTPSGPVPKNLKEAQTLSLARVPEGRRHPVDRNHAQKRQARKHVLANGRLLVRHGTAEPRRMVQEIPRTLPHAPHQRPL